MLTLEGDTLGLQKSDARDALSYISQLDRTQTLLFASIVKPRIKVLSDVLVLNKFMWYTGYDVTEQDLTKYKDKKQTRSHLVWILDKIRKLEHTWTLKRVKLLEQSVLAQTEKLQWRTIEVFQPIRIAVCQDKISPPLFESIYLLGYEKTVNNITNAIDVLT